MANDNIQSEPDARPLPEPHFAPSGYDREFARHRPDGTLSTIIPYHNPKALFAYYCGVFALIPGLGLALGPLALILGILGLQYAKAQPNAKGIGHAITGIVLGLLTTFFNVAISALLGIALMKF